MISTALQSTIEAIIPNTYLAMGDEGITVPYCVHKEAATPEYLKSGIVGYSYVCEVAIIDTLPEALETLVQSVKNAIIALEGTTVSSTKFDSVIWDGDEPDFDIDSKMYINILKFTIETSNR
jgi:hypothetical protein